MRTKPIRVAILGGGPSALATAWELTSGKNKNKYEVTLYQLGWRLGGKCASGRNQDDHYRIQEHGLHVFFGYYDNAFEILEAVYQELAAQGAEKYTSVFDAMSPSSSISLGEHTAHGWHGWHLNVPEMPGRPGKGRAPDLFQTLMQALRVVEHYLRKLLLHGQSDVQGRSGTRQIDQASLPEQMLNDLSQLFHTGLTTASSIGETLFGGLQGRHRLDANTSRAADRGQDGQADDGARAQGLAGVLDGLWKGLARNWEVSGFDSWWDNLSHDLRRAFIIADFGLALGIGVLRSGFLVDREGAIKRLNEVEFRDWLRHQGAKEVTLRSAELRALYDLTFAYPDQDHDTPGNLAAGNTLNALLNMIHYRGPFMWKMRAGTGDVVAAPLYKALKRRGVKFEFFSRVTDLVPSSFHDQIETIRISKQVTLKGQHYDPLIPVKGLDCWPSEPLYDQIKEGETLKAQQINLESHWTSWKDTGGDVNLRYGRDFDVAVLAIPVAALHDICPRIIAQKADWQQMIKNLKTVQTQSVQMLFQDGSAALGDAPAGTVFGADDASQLNAAADMSDTLGNESWEIKGPKYSAIMGGVLPGPARIPPRHDRRFPTDMQERVKDNAQAFTESGAAVMWPKIAAPGSFDWQAVWAPPGVLGANKLESQYLRANIDPDQRYTLSVAGSTKYRLRTDGSGYDNLYLAGDWIDNPGNVGGFESTIMSGRLAARAISGHPATIARVPKGSTYYDMRAPYENPATDPIFVEYNGMQTFPGPFSFEGVELWSFFIEADMEKLKGLADQFFNIPSGGAVSYVPISSTMMMTFMDISNARSPFVPHASGAREREVAFWIMMGREDTAGSGNIVDISGFNPYLVIDNALGYTEGRNVWGYLKQVGNVTLPDADTGQNGFEVDVFGVRDDPFREQWNYIPLLKMTPSPDFSDAEETAIGSLGDAVNIVDQAFKGPRFDPTLTLGNNLWNDFIKRETSQLFLKQFRDIVRPDRACYQAITETKMRFDKLRGVHLEGGFELEISKVFNADLVGDLGLKPKMHIPFGTKVVMDMTLENGRVIWEART